MTPQISVIMTVYNREPLVLMNTFEALGKNDLDGVEVVVIDDGSTVDYGPLVETITDLPLRWFRHSTIEERPTTYHIDGHNNPAYVNNVAINEAQGDVLLFLSSDTLIQPHALTVLKKSSLERSALAFQTIDLDSGALFCGPQKIWPMCWALAARRQFVVECGGFDEKYLDGMAFEDNDFTARLTQRTGSLIITNHANCWHQSHPQTAYSDNWEGFKRSEKYTVEKWGGVPWRPDDKCFPYEAVVRTERITEIVPKSQPAVAVAAQPQASAP